MSDAFIGVSFFARTNYDLRVDLLPLCRRDKTTREPAERNSNSECLKGIKARAKQAV